MQEVKIMINQDTTRIYLDNFNLLPQEEIGNQVDSNINYQYNQDLKSRYFVRRIDELINGIEKNILLIKSRRNM